MSFNYNVICIGEIMKIKSLKPRVIILDQWDDHILCQFTREELREFAKDNGILCGKNKSDTINYLLAGMKVSICATLGN